MKELIKITTNEDGQQLVSAKELHEFLGLSKHLTQWIKPYINERNDYGFIENVDFTRIDGEVNPTNGIPTIDYAITINMAKELSMLSKTEKGKQARKYFIKCEEKLKEEMQNKELTEADRIVKLLSVIPESERGKYMLELVDKFYFDNNTIEKANKNIHKDKGLTIDKVKDILRQAYDEAYVTTKGGYVIMLKKVVHKYLVSNGIRKHDFNKFVKDNNIAKINKDGYAWNQFRVDGKKNTWEYFIKAELFE